MYWDKRSRTLNWPYTKTIESLFLFLTLYWDERVVRIDFWIDLLLRREGRSSSFWPCTEMRGLLFLLLTLYWDERVARIDFWTDLVLRQEGRSSSFWLCTETRRSLILDKSPDNITEITQQCYNSVVECGDTTLRPFSNYNHIKSYKDTTLSHFFK